MILYQKVKMLFPYFKQIVMTLNIFCCVTLMSTSWTPSDLSSNSIWKSVWSSLISELLINFRLFVFIKVCSNIHTFLAQEVLSVYCFLLRLWKNTRLGAFSNYFDFDILSWSFYSVYGYSIVNYKDAVEIFNPCN